MLESQTAPPHDRKCFSTQTGPLSNQATPLCIEYHLELSLSRPLDLKLCHSTGGGGSLKTWIYSYIISTF